MVRIKNEKNNYIFFFSLSVEATNIVDFETEIFIHELIQLIKDENNYNQNINFSIVLDNNPNAFINKDNRLFISTGLLKYAPSYEALIGVLAHEIGHLANFHISKKIDSIENLNTIKNLSTLSIIAGSLLTKNNEHLIESLITNQVGIQNYYLSFSRDQEREADYYAVNTLNKLNLSTQPLIKFLNLLEKKSLIKGMTEEYFKFSTHPIYKERYSIINQNNINQKNNSDSKINNKFLYIKAKIFGFTENDTTGLYIYLNDQYFNYTKSIILSKKGKLKKSMSLINELIKKNLNQNFLFETKADILFSHGYTEEAKKFYEKVLLIYPNNHYANKRVFEIKYNNGNFKNIEFYNTLFNKYVFLLEIFPNDVILQNQFTEVAIILNEYNWISFFKLNKKIYTHEKKEVLKDMKVILKNTDNKILKKLINQKMYILNNE